VSDLLRRVEKAIQDRRLIAESEAVVVAVSGGLDSMALLHALHILGKTHGWKLVVAHFNHLLRGKESDRDERLVARTAASLGWPFESSQGDVKQFARARKISMEMAARALRHQFLARTARKLGVRHIALGHHADDQLELFFVRLFRGAGTEGLAGMKWSSPSPVDWDITLVRPFLAEPKSELLQFARGNKVRFHRDRTNRSTDILRNRIRQKLLPQLRREYQPEIHRTVLRAMELMRGESEFIEATARAWLRKPRRAGWDSLPLAVQRAVIQNELLRLGIQPQFEWVEKLRGEPRWITLAPEVACRRTTIGTLEKRANEDRDFTPAEALIILSGRSGTGVFGSRRFRWRVSNGTKLPRRRGTDVEYFDAAMVGDRILLRHWRPGDRFQPIGMSRPVKLQDLFVNQKIPRQVRRTLVVAATLQNEIFWVERLRIGEQFKIGPATKEILRWRWERIA
jgi:tRNA(Ile)-lysidine synthase